MHSSYQHETFNHQLKGNSNVQIEKFQLTQVSDTLRLHQTLIETLQLTVQSFSPLKQTNNPSTSQVLR